MGTTRTPQETLGLHLQAALTEDPDAVLADYTDDPTLITPAGVARGRDQLRKVFEKLFSDIPQARWELVSATFEGDVLLFEWKAESEHTKVEDGIDTIVFRDGLIDVQTVRYTLIQKG